MSMFEKNEKVYILMCYAPISPLSPSSHHPLSSSLPPHTILSPPPHTINSPPLSLFTPSSLPPHIIPSSPLSFLSPPLSLLTLLLSHSSLHPHPILSPSSLQTIFYLSLIELIACQCIDTKDQYDINKSYLHIKKQSLPMYNVQCTCVVLPTIPPSN